MNNPIIETDIADILKDIKSDQKEILKEVGNLKQEFNREIGSLKQEVNKEIGSLKQEVNEVKVSLESAKGDIKALGTKTEQLNQRIANSEITNRGILIGLVVIILGGAAKLFGFMGTT